MLYMICNNGKYVGQDMKAGFYITEDIDLAKSWEKLDKANNVLKMMQQCKKFKNYHFEVKYCEQSTVKTQKQKTPEPIELDYDINQKLEEIVIFAKEIEKRKTYLYQLIHNAELELIDIYHAAEFQTLNAAQGYKLYKRLHDVCTKRREYKNEVQVIENTLKTRINGCDLGNLEKSIAGLETRKYAPRINADLFNL